MIDYVISSLAIYITIQDHSINKDFSPDYSTIPLNCITKLNTWIYFSFH